MIYFPEGIGVVVEFGEKSSSHKSLDVFMETYGRKVDRAYVIHSKNLRVDGRSFTSRST